MAMQPLRGKPFQSKLVPFTDHIRSWRRQGKTYAEISRLLAEQGTPASPSTVFSFVRVRSRRRQPITMLESASSNALPSKATNSQDAIAALKQKPMASPAKPSFHFDETKPLTLKPQ